MKNDTETNRELTNEEMAALAAYFLHDQPKEAAPVQDIKTQDTMNAWKMSAWLSQMRAG